MSTEKKALAAVAVVSFFWGTTYIVSRFTVAYVPGLYLASLRNLIAGTLIISFFLLRGRAWPERTELVKAAFLGLIMIAVSSGLSIWSVEYITGSLASLIGATIPLWIALFSMFHGGRMTIRLWAGLLTGFAGIAMIFYDHIAELLAADFRFGIMLAASSCVTWAAASVYTSRIRTQLGLLYGVGWQMLFAGLFLLVYCAFTNRILDLGGLASPAWGGILYLAFIGSILTYSCYVFAIRNLPPARVGVYAYVNPIVAVLLGHAWLGEKVTVMIAVGTLVTLAGVYMVNSAFRNALKRAGRGTG